MSEPINEKYTCITAKVYSEKERYHGLLLIIANNQSRTLETASVVIVNNDKFRNINASDDWQVIEREIQKVRYANNFATAISNDAQEVLYQMGKRPESIEDLLRGVHDHRKIKQIVYEQLRRLIRDDQIEINVHSRQLKTIERDPSDFDHKPDSEPESAHTYIRSSLILDPIAGKPISDMKPGSTIMLKITDLGAAAQNYIHKNGLMAPKGTKPAPAEVVSVENTDEGLLLECAFSPELRTRIIEAERVMVQTTSEKERKGAGKETGAEKAKGSGGIIFIVAAVFVILAIAMVFIVFG